MDLNLANNGLANEGVTALVKGLEGNTVLTSLNLSCNDLHQLPDGCTALTPNLDQKDLATWIKDLAKVLEGNTCLRKVNLDYNDLFGTAGKALRRAIGLHKINDGHHADPARYREGKVLLELPSSVSDDYRTDSSDDEEGV